MVELYDQGIESKPIPYRRVSALGRCPRCSDTVGSAYEELALMPEEIKIQQIQQGLKYSCLNLLIRKA